MSWVTTLRAPSTAGGLSPCSCGDCCRGPCGFRRERSVVSTEVGIKFTLNGRVVSMTVASSVVLLTLLRELLDLKGTRASCERGVCGACTVLVDDTPIAACSVFAFDVDGARVET